MQIARTVRNFQGVSVLTNERTNTDKLYVHYVHVYINAIILNVQYVTNLFLENQYRLFCRIRRIS